MEKKFTKCPKCKHQWLERELFLEDKDISIIGYQASYEDLVAGAFLFNHSCGTTMGIKVEKLEDLYDGTIFNEKLVGSEECPEFCLYEKNLEPCPAKCECAFVREIIQILK